MSPSSSSMSTTASLPARQEVTSRAGVHGDWCKGAEGLLASVEQWTTSLSGIQLFHAAGLQVAGIPKSNTPSHSPALCATGTASYLSFVCVHYLKIWSGTVEMNYFTIWFLAYYRARAQPPAPLKTPLWMWMCLWPQCSSVSASMLSTLWTLHCTAGNRWHKIQAAETLTVYFEPWNDWFRSRFAG